MHIPIVDCFPYFNEVELLELRIKLLWDHVDQFIITEGNRTHSGISKPYTCQSVLEKLGLFCDKIKIVKVELPSLEDQFNNWYRERLQRNAASQFFKEGYVYIVSDCDEIINPEFIQYYAQAVLDNPNKLFRINMFHLNCQANLTVVQDNNSIHIHRSGMMLSKHHTEKYTLSDLREDYNMNKFDLEYDNVYLLDHENKSVVTGWHFSWMGGTNAVKLKMSSFLHSYDSNTDIFKNAVAPIYSREMYAWLDNYNPGPGSTDPYGRPEYRLEQFPIEFLPDLIFKLPHIQNYLFNYKHEKTSN